MMIEKRVLSNKITIYELLPFYKVAIDSCQQVEQQQAAKKGGKSKESKEANVRVKNEPKSEEKKQEELKLLTMMTLPKFLVFMAELARLMFPWEQSREKSFSEFLWPTQVERGKSMYIDELTKKVLDEAIWQRMQQYRENLEYVFTIYMQENFENKGKSE